MHTQRNNSVWSSILNRCHPIHHTIFCEDFVMYFYSHPLFEPRREKTGFLHMQKQRRRSASCLCFRYTDSTIPLLPKYETKALTIFCNCTARFVSDLVGNPEDRFSHNEAHLKLHERKTTTYHQIHTLTGLGCEKL